MKLLLVALAVVAAPILADVVDFDNGETHIDELLKHETPEEAKQFEQVVTGFDAAGGKKGKGAKCDEAKYVKAKRNFHDNLGMPTIVQKYTVFRKIYASIIADGIEGHRALAKATLQYVEDMKGNFGCYAPRNLHKLGYSIFQIKKIILKLVTNVVNALNVEHLATDYSCYVKTSLDTHHEAMKFIGRYYYHLLSGRARCNAVLGLAYGVAGMYKQACGEGVARYVYGGIAAPMSLLYPQCRLAPAVDKKTDKKLKADFAIYN